jgi:iron transport multicopper oxidase
MRFIASTIAILAAVLIYGVASVDPTDEYRDADPEQSGYLPNHNMDPAIVNSAQFGQLWTVSFNQGEQVSFATPVLVSQRLFKTCPSLHPSQR